jgi:hypothetical protein
MSNYTTFLSVVEVFVGESLRSCTGLYKLGQVSLMISASLYGVSVLITVKT